MLLSKQNPEYYRDKQPLYRTGARVNWDQVMSVFSHAKSTRILHMLAFYLAEMEDWLTVSITCTYSTVSCRICGTSWCNRTLNYSLLVRSCFIHGAAEIACDCQWLMLLKWLNFLTQNVQDILYKFVFENTNA